jgi:hypothetical protein
MKRLNRIPHVERVDVVRSHTLELHFDDGLVRTLEFLRPQEGPMVAPLNDPEFFARATVDHGTVAWPNGLDLDPVVLHGDRKPVGRALFREVRTVSGPRSLAQ